MIIMFISLVYDLFPVQMVTKSVVLMFTYKRTNAVQPSGSFYPLDVDQQTEVRILILTHVAQCSGDSGWRCREENNNNIECGKTGK